MVYEVDVKQFVCFYCFVSEDDVLSNAFIRAFGTVFILKILVYYPSNFCNFVFRTFSKRVWSGSLYLYICRLCQTLHANFTCNVIGMRRLQLIMTGALALTLIQACVSRNAGDKVMHVGSDSAPTVDTVVYDPVRDSIESAEARKKTIRGLRGSDALVDFMKESGDWDRYSQGILPQMARDEADYARKLLASDHSRFIIVDKQRMKVILFDRFGVQVKSYGMACAKNYGTKHKRADSRTPEGFFSVSGIHDSTDWLFTDDDGVTSKVKGQFGPRFIRLQIPGTSQIGIHGTCAPWSIGGRRSHGCIRITNDNILELVELVEVGMPVIVSPGVKDIKVNLEEGYDIPSVATVVGGRRAEYKGPLAPAAGNDSGKSVGDSVAADVERVPHDTIVSGAENVEIYDTIR